MTNLIDLRHIEPAPNTPGGSTAETVTLVSYTTDTTQGTQTLTVRMSDDRQFDLVDRSGNPVQDLELVLHESRDTLSVSFVLGPEFKSTASVALGSTTNPITSVPTVFTGVGSGSEFSITVTTTAGMVKTWDPKIKVVAPPPPAEIDYAALLDKDFEHLRGAALHDAPVHALAGITSRDAAALESSLGIRTIGDLANHSMVVAAQALVVAPR